MRDLSRIQKENLWITLGIGIQRLPKIRSWLYPIVMWIVYATINKKSIEEFQGLVADNKS